MDAEPLIKLATSEFRGKEIDNQDSVNFTNIKLNQVITP
jgi:hypothetical protein